MVEEAATSGEYHLAEMKKMKPGSYILIDGEVLRVDKLQTSKPGKHGSAKARIEARGVFTDVKKIFVKPADTKIQVPVILKKNAQVVAVMGDTAQLMDLETYETYDVPVPDEFKNQLDSGIEVVVWRYGPHVMIVSKK